MIDIIRIRIRIRKKYENKYDIGNIRPYPIRFHPRLPLYINCHVWIVCNSTSSSEQFGLVCIYGDPHHRSTSTI